MKQNRTTVIIFVVILALFFAGVVKLFLLRFQAGDIYPAYSTLRSDPLGCRVFYDALGNLEGVGVDRNLSSLRNLKPEKPFTLMFLGVPAAEGDTVTEPVFEIMDNFVTSGGRLVMAFSPVIAYRDKYDQKDADDDGSEGTDTDTESDPCRESDSESDTGTGEDVPGDSGTEDDPDAEGDEDSADEEPEIELIKTVSISEKWGVRYEHESQEKEKSLYAAPAVSGSGFSRVSWHSSLWFSELSPEWRVIYSINDRPVVIERTHGSGTLVFCSDTYFASNEALRNEVHPSLLAWLAGDSGTVMFDESHFGIRKSPGIATLLRRYNLHGVVISLIVLALLMIWKNASSLVPPVLPEFGKGESGDPASLRDHSSGLASLLRKHIGKRSLIEVCLNEWKKSFVSENEAARKNAEIYTQMKMTVSSGDGSGDKPGDPVDDYRSLCRVLSEGKKA